MSTIASVKAALVALARSALPTDVQTIYGPATTATTMADAVVTVGTVLGVSDLDSLSGSTTTEDYTVEVTLSVTLPGADTQQTATEAALAYWLTLKAAVLAYPGRQLGVSGVMDAVPVGDFELTEYAGDFGRSAALKTAIRIKAQGI